MPNFLGSDDTEFGRLIGSIAATGKTLASQPNTVIANNAGQPVLFLGLATNPPGGGVPSGTGVFALQLLDPSTQAVILQLGEQFAGVPGPGLVLFSGASPIALFDDAGVTVYDASGNERVGLGLLPGGDYGLGIFSDSNNGTYVRLAPPVTAEYAATQSTTSQSSVPLNGPSVTFSVSQSGQALILTSCVIGMPGATTSVQGETTVKIGTDYYAPAGSSVTSSTAVGLQTTVTGMELVTGLTPGSVTAEMYFSSTYGQSINFSDSVITVIPY